ncbi:hypothetical protein ZWY2020_034076, partial [Hordeum vulgare]
LSSLSEEMGRVGTSISYESASPHNAESSTFVVHAHNFIVFGLSFRVNFFVSLATFPNTNNPEIRTVAAMVGGDKVAFYHCAFYSPHHTLFDQAGRHYYPSFYIQGNIDFIFGGDRSIFQASTLPRSNDHKEESNNNDFVFLKGKVYGDYSRVLFAETYLSKTVNPARWTDYGYSGSTEHLMLRDFNCTGPGAEASQRVPWSRRLDKTEAEKFITIDFINGKEWLPTFYY